MKKIITLLLYINSCFLSTTSVAQIYTGDNVYANISNSFIPTVSNINVSLNGNIGNDFEIFSVLIDIAHPSDTDLTIYLFSPSGDSLLLSERNGGHEADYTSTIFQDNRDDITISSPPFTGVFEPEGGTFSNKFSGTNINGNWSLKIKDDNITNDGTFLGFQINFLATSGLIKTYIPDDNFEQYLIDQGHDIILDDSVYKQNIERIEKLYISNLGIYSVQGLENFDSLIYFNSYGNSINTIDVSNNKNLEEIYLRLNSLTTLNVAQNTKLKYLLCYGNQLTSIDVSHNLELEYLDCSVNPIYNLDVSINKNLKYLFCSDNLLSNIDVSNNLDLLTLDCSKNYLTNIDVTNNLKLNYLDFYKNDLTDIDVSNNKFLRVLHCDYNKLNTLDLKNNNQLYQLYCTHNELTEIDLRNGTNYLMIPYTFPSFLARFNPFLQCIYVDSSNFESETYYYWDFPTTAFLATNENECSKHFEITTENQRSDFVITPNPVYENFLINSKDEVIEVKIFNSIGSKVEYFQHQFIYDISHLAKGLYYLQIKTYKETKIIKMLKN